MPRTRMAGRHSTVPPFTRAGSFPARGCGGIPVECAHGDGGVGVVGKAGARSAPDVFRFRVKRIGSIEFAQFEGQFAITHTDGREFAMTRGTLWRPFSERHGFKPGPKRWRILGFDVAYYGPRVAQGSGAVETVTSRSACGGGV